MINYTTENPAHIKDELLPLMLDHYKADYRNEAADLDINWDQYSEAYEAGVMVPVIARDEDGTIVGYMSSIVSEHQHNKGVLQANMDTMYVAPEYRKEGVASKMLEVTEDLLVNLGVSWYAATFREESTAEAVTGKYGYKKVECTFGKTLRRK